MKITRLMPLIGLFLFGNILTMPTYAAVTVTNNTNQEITFQWWQNYQATDCSSQSTAASVMDAGYSYTFLDWQGALFCKGIIASKMEGVPDNSSCNFVAGSTRIPDPAANYTITVNPIQGGIVCVLRKSQ